MKARWHKLSITQRRLVQIVWDSRHGWISRYDSRLSKISGIRSQTIEACLRAGLLTYRQSDNTIHVVRGPPEPVAVAPYVPPFNPCERPKSQKE